MLKRHYHGWIVVEHKEGSRDTFHAEWRNSQNELCSSQRWFSPVEAMEFWDNQLNTFVYFEPTPLSAYHVYTEQWYRQ